MEERRAELAEGYGLAPEDLAALAGEPGLTAELAESMIENAIGTHALPLGIALNFVVNGGKCWSRWPSNPRSWRSFVHGPAGAPRWVRSPHTPPEMIGQMQILDARSAGCARRS
jgi:hydroxymethylglutaryl-CoA reductase